MTVNSVKDDIIIKLFKEATKQMIKFRDKTNKEQIYISLTPLEEYLFDMKDIDRELFGAIYLAVSMYKKELLDEHLTKTTNKGRGK